MRVQASPLPDGAANRHRSVLPLAPSLLLLLPGCFIKALIRRTIGHAVAHDPLCPGDSESHHTGGRLFAKTWLISNDLRFRRERSLQHARRGKNSLRARALLIARQVPHAGRSHRSPIDRWRDAGLVPGHVRWFWAGLPVDSGRSNSVPTDEENQEKRNFSEEDMHAC